MVNIPLVDSVHPYAARLVVGFRRLGFTNRYFSGFSAVNPKLTVAGRVS